MSCPPPAILLTLALGDDDAADRAATRHVKSCATCTRELQRLREVAAGLHLAQEPGIASPGCLDEMTIAAMACDDATAFDPAATTHLAGCAQCRTQLADAIATLQTVEISNEIERLESGHRTARRGVPNWARLAAVAAALAGLALVPRLERVGHRAPASPARDLRDADPTITMTLPPRIVAPSGSVMRVDQLVWTSVPGASRYAVRIFDHEGTAVWEAEVSDTSVVLPPTVVLTPGAVYLWKVDAHTSWNRSAQSELVEFRTQKAAR